VTDQPRQGREGEPGSDRPQGTTSPRHIFIVGMPRTGTTLLRNILNGSNQVGLGGESHFLGDPSRLRPPRGGFWDELGTIGDISTDSGVARIVDHIFSRKGDNFWGRLARGADRNEFLAELLASDRSPRSLLDLAYAFHAQGKPIRGEKTPEHVHSVPVLFEWFPDAKVIHTFRDPRAIYVSQMRKQRAGRVAGFGGHRPFRLALELYSSLRLIVAWRKVVRLHRWYSKAYPGLYYLCRYEDLVAEPKASLQRISQFLGIAFSEVMLDQKSVNSSFVSRGKVEGFEAEAIDRWRSHLHPVIRHWFGLWCKAQLVRFGYEP
jgi:hypothetical protein